MRCRSVFLLFSGMLFAAGAFGEDFPVIDFPGSNETVANASTVSFPDPQWKGNSLTATTFPKTLADLSFTDRLRFYYDSYLPYEVVYDENGVCVSNCAYHGITIQEDMQAVDDATDEMADLIAEYEEAEDEEEAEDAADLDIPYDSPPLANFPPSQQPPIDEVTGVARNWCQNGRSTELPLRYPVDMTNFKYRIGSDFGYRPNSPNGSRFHPAVDILCPKGTPVYATADGIAYVKREDERGGAGLYITIKHAHGLETQYLHLDKELVRDGQQVKACDKIALSGNSGKSVSGGAYGPHLDYRVRFTSARNKFVDLLCPCKVATRSNQSSNNELNMTCKHSLFFAPYKFKKYNPNTDDTKRSLWRVNHGHCMRKNTDLLPDEVAP